MTPGRTFSILGTDFATRDDSAIRDYIHVMDLADAHVRAASHLTCRAGVAEACNLGTGTSVLELATAVRRATAAKPRSVLGWEPQLSAMRQAAA